MTAVPALDILDLAPIPAGATAADALGNTLDLARRAEDWGYQRYWVAEHHFAHVASAAPTVLIAEILAATRRIRVGSAAVLIGFTTAPAVADAFGVLSALHPGRVDVGVGRTGQRLRTPSPGAPAVNPKLVAGYERLLQDPAAEPASFTEQVDDVLALFAGTYAGRGVPLRSPVAEAAQGSPVWVFGSSAGESAQLAGARGLPFVANYHVSPATTVDASNAYREAFRPSEFLAEPRLVVSADVVVAETDAAARDLAAGFPAWVHSIRFGDGAIAYPRDSADLTDEQRAAVADRTETQFVGDPGRVAAGLRELADRTGADELVITSVTHDHGARLRSHELLAKEWGLL
ncbi:Luciferase family oxidoreductase, group 1 OS=Tsukamurella paurometabola (strain ATCC 8368 / DSM/ CCUG 35730 / CIP 100753 / JCM 10117 / KCTC 9821 / NBRC 16120 / NCIMB 702349 / NCTC 13040) OX=521096 GN=Tpau_1982 PE=4 SV=1 [Tsukamurella paurometabola]|uniref:Luciferase family oxidoreductase, group 1 n=1 Tax=Tsukamurella paurometabola (strain ATCC 8368 / DSM 20162 / CCUG 35730 / CIP 100753 / JCM 10117 / KCTC 9821 / NBRC 16120 / NCIMB 702349 / NCTC 13040) TaxID=521096 RepID=D5UNM6_TSUPD|nr:MsnO8 family LLM class oxidoreductase [Tsukamurella paurometabola]ADG78594.1 luciferase family oxidoreductase, group 1 [Tsukamurella paurometabola DSM 20162]SUP32350.1 luciferase family oxidoreductase, group 1 [Tsukamurella paurometabola]